jgi:hypothetical protein
MYGLFWNGAAMNHVHDAIRRHALEWAGVPSERAPLAPAWPSLDDLRASEWSARFETLMRNRLVIGGGRYGWIGAARKLQWCRVQSAVARLTEYTKTGNLEMLVDVANLCLLEFEEGAHPMRHWRSKDDEMHVMRRQ